jgi:hypothetical protein
MLPRETTSLHNAALLPTLLCRCALILQQQLPSSAEKSCNPLWRITSHSSQDSWPYPGLCHNPHLAAAALLLLPLPSD